MTKHPLEAGSKAPDFTLPDQANTLVTLSELRGNKVILFFYPEAGTPGCTKEACDFRDNTRDLTDAGYKILGISPDSVQKQADWAKKHELPFPLLSDEDLSVHDAYGTAGLHNVLGKYISPVRRSTFVLDEEGYVTDTEYTVRAKGHVEKLKDKLGVGSTFVLNEEGHLAHALYAVDLENHVESLRKLLDVA